MQMPSKARIMQYTHQCKVMQYQLRENHRECGWTYYYYYYVEPSDSESEEYLGNLTILNAKRQ